MILENELKVRAKKIEQRLFELVPDLDLPQNRVFKAMRYSLEAGGKRLRPILFTEFYTLAGGRDFSAALDFACALEMIHTYSLIHDDLPCMDDDDMRRGKPSCHKAFDYATALLAGDGLLNRAFEVMALTDTENSLKTLSYIGKMSGIFGMIGGQTIDVCNDGCLSDIKALENMVNLKTGALIKAACVGGCMLAGADDDTRRAALLYAQNVGLAFQIRDDLLDAIGDTETMGKKVGSDSKLNKTTFYTELGEEKCKEMVDTLSQEAIEKISVFDNNEFITQLTSWLVGRKI